MAEDIKEEENPQEEQDQDNTQQDNSQEVSDGLIPEENGEQTNEEQPIEETPPQEDSNENTQPTPEPPKEVVSDSETQTSEMDHEIIEDTENHIQKKQTKIQKILIITAGVLAGILVLGFILYLFGVFDPEEPPKPVVTEQAMMDMNQTKEPEKYIFDSKDINIDRLNSKLRILTKYEIIGTEEEERIKELEKNSELSTAQINELLNAEQEKIKEEQRLAEEAKLKAEADKKAEEERLKAEAEKKAEEERLKAENPYDLLKFIQVLANDTLFESLNEQAGNYQVNISRCEDNNRELFLIGPFNSNAELNEAFRTIININQSSTKKDLARLEFNRICN